MNAKELKKILENIDDDAIIQIAVHDFEKVTNDQDVYVDYEYDKNEALVLYIQLDDNEYIESQ